MITCDLPVGVMENDVEVRERIEEALRSTDCAPCVLTSIDEALSFARADAHAVMIVDLNMGPERKTEGLEVIERVKHIRPQTRICLYSQHVVEGNEYVRRAKRIGVDYVASKSVNILEDITRIVTALVEGPPTYEDVFEAPLRIGPNTRRRGRLSVRLTYKGRSIPIPEQNPGKEEGE
jgi:DNA-binding NarL/FixJ family response regulator